MTKTEKIFYGSILAVLIIMYLYYKHEQKRAKAMVGGHYYVPPSSYKPMTAPNTIVYD